VVNKQQIQKGAGTPWSHLRLRHEAQRPRDLAGLVLLLLTSSNEDVQ
jgi:hypothetical protein